MKIESASTVHWVVWSVVTSERAKIGLMSIFRLVEWIPALAGRRDSKVQRGEPMQRRRRLPGHTQMLLVVVRFGVQPSGERESAVAGRAVQFDHHRAQEGQNGDTKLGGGVQWPAADHVRGRGSVVTARRRLGPVTAHQMGLPGTDGQPELGDTALDQSRPLVSVSRRCRV